MIPAWLKSLVKTTHPLIDSSHIVKTGSDVHFELTELLPRLRRGVVVHFHDVFYPFEYPEKWVLEDNNSWNEIYYLQTFLMHNDAFEIIYFNDYFSKVHGDTILASLPPDVSALVRLNPGGGLWLRRRDQCGFRVGLRSSETHHSPESRMHIATDEMRASAAECGVQPEIHSEDFIYQFLAKHPNPDLSLKPANFYYHDGLELLAQVKHAN